jgi:hypothetical protein
MIYKVKKKNLNKLVAYLKKQSKPLIRKKDK